MNRTQQRKKEPDDPDRPRATTRHPASTPTRCNRCSSRSSAPSSARTCCSSGWRSPCFPAATCSWRACPGWPRRCPSRRSPRRSAGSSSASSSRPTWCPPTCRDAGLPPAHRRVPDPARPGLHEPAARRRDQPRARQGAERPARGDAGAAGHHRPRDLPGARAVPRHGDAEPDRVRGHLPAARGAGRPVHDEGRRRLPERHRGARDRRPRAAPRRTGPRDAHARRT